MLVSKLLSKRIFNTKNVSQCYCKNVAQNIEKFKGSVNKIVKKTYGQPAPVTHPHLINNGEVTPGIRREEFLSRRQKLLDKILSKSLRNNESGLKPHLVVIPSASKKYMSENIPYVFRQNSDFLYLTGCQEPDTCLVITTTGSSDNFKSVLFLRQKDSHSELWDGPRTGIEDASSFFGVDQGLPMSELDTFLKLYLKSYPQSNICYDFLTPVQDSVQSTMQKFLKNKICSHWESPINFVHELRLIKSPAEVQLMKKSCQIASKAIADAIDFSRPGITEHQIFAKVDYECRMNGAEFLAYPPVVAGGDRATIIHYINNDRVVQDKEMVLMDAGCEYHGYSSDITRTFPVNGKFTLHQQIIYEIVETVQKELIELCGTFLPLDQLFDNMCVLLGRYLKEVGLISKNANKNEVMRGAYKFCPHHVSHYLGMDVHDTASISRSINLIPGMIVTVEPGIYIRDQANIPEEFRGIGIRVEDDILITENGPVVLSNCPKSRYEIEKLASKSKKTT